MPRIRIIPVLLLHEGGLYKTVQFHKPAYIGDPINTVKIFNEKEADELILLDFRASKAKSKIDFIKLNQIAGEAFMPMAYGGGIQSYEDAQKVFDAGFEKIVLNSILFTNPHIIEKMVSAFGAQAVVASVDVKKNLFGKYKVYSHSATINTGYDPVIWIKKLEGYGVGEILLNSIDKDGTWDGYDLPLIKRISHSINIPLIACGGAAGMNDFRNAVAAGASAIAAGSVFVYQKKGMGVLISFPSEEIDSL